MSAMTPRRAPSGQGYLASLEIVAGIACAGEASHSELPKSAGLAASAWCTNGPDLQGDCRHEEAIWGLKLDEACASQSLEQHGLKHI